MIADYDGQSHAGQLKPIDLGLQVEGVHSQAISSTRCERAIFVFDFLNATPSANIRVEGYINGIWFVCEEQTVSGDGGHAIFVDCRGFEGLRGLLVSTQGEPAAGTTQVHLTAMMVKMN